MFEGSADSSLASGNGIDDEDVIGPDQKPEQKPLPPPIQSPNDNEDEFISSGGLNFMADIAEQISRVLYLSVGSRYYGGI